MSFEILTGTALVAFVALVLLVGAAGLLTGVVAAGRAVAARRPAVGPRHQARPAYRHRGLVTHH